MTILELHEWMNSRFDSTEKELQEIKECMRHIDKRVTIHDHWIWASKGAVALVAPVLGFLYFKIKP